MAYLSVRDKAVPLLLTLLAIGVNNAYALDPCFKEYVEVQDDLGCHDCTDEVQAAMKKQCAGALSTSAQIFSSNPLFSERPECQYKCMQTCTRTVPKPGTECCTGYDGKNCDMDLDACAVQKCHKDAFCQDKPPPAGFSEDDRECSCRPGYKSDSDGGCTIDSTKETLLYQSDFEKGTVIIDKPGRYILAEDIIFNPNNRSSGGANKPYVSQFAPQGKYDRRAFGLGFFAAISIIATEGVDLDMNGKTIDQSVEHALMQRFYAHIELANAPFHYDNGPHNFTNANHLQSARNVRIYNGVLGRSSHHGIHGIGCENIVIRDMKILDFEVAGISINGGVNFVVDNSVIGPGRQDVPVLGLFSTGMFIKPYVEDIINSVDPNCPGRDATITLNKVEYTAVQIRDALQEVIDKTYDAVVCGIGEVPDIVNNNNNKADRTGIVRRGLPDGAAMYGMVFANYGSHTQGLADIRRNQTCIDPKGEIVGMVNEEDDGLGWHRCLQDGAHMINTGNDNIQITNVKIRGIDLQVNEVEALRTTNFDASRKQFLPSAQVDVVGAVYQYEANIDAKFGTHGPFIGNPISNAQLLVTKFIDQCFVPGPTIEPTGRCRRDTVDKISRRENPGACFHNLGGDSDKLQIELNQIRQETLDWAAEGGLYNKEDWVICGGDNMFHVNKGAYGIRVDAGQNFKLHNVDIENIRNFAPPGSPLCGSKPRVHPHMHQEHYMGGDANGIMFTGSKKADLHEVRIRHVQSSAGNAYGVHLLMDTDQVTGVAHVGSIQSSYRAWIGEESADSFYGRRATVRLDHGKNAAPISNPFEIQKYACRPDSSRNNTRMAFMAMEDDDGMDMGDDQVEMIQLRPLEDDITCDLIIELEPKTAEREFEIPRSAADNVVCPLNMVQYDGNKNEARNLLNTNESEPHVSKSSFISIVVISFLIVIMIAAVAINQTRKKPTHTLAPHYDNNNFDNGASNSAGQVQMQKLEEDDSQAADDSTA